jgi:hypothetical protein
MAATVGRCHPYRRAILMEMHGAVTAPVAPQPDIDVISMNGG